MVRLAGYGMVRRCGILLVMTSAVTAVGAGDCLNVVKPLALTVEAPIP